MNQRFERRNQFSFFAKSCQMLAATYTTGRKSHTHSCNSKFIGIKSSYLDKSMQNIVEHSCSLH